MIRLNEVIHPLQDVQPALIRRASVARHVVGLTRLTSSWFHHGASYHAAIVSLMEYSFHPHFRLVALITRGMLVSCKPHNFWNPSLLREEINYLLRPSWVR
ncbi:hypothetical protein AcV5_004507 [Taiwanofungus camphoratus]|nr:hypothetical protein AcW2_000897 [Antrodia cinnamomea]KAI0936343.1 hypothetical protein AcV5_004507 [Antrodia cinnamomea]